MIVLALRRRYSDDDTDSRDGRSRGCRFACTRICIPAPVRLCLHKKNVGSGNLYQYREAIIDSQEQGDNQETRQSFAYLQEIEHFGLVARYRLLRSCGNSPPSTVLNKLSTHIPRKNLSILSGGFVLTLDEESGIVEAYGDLER